MIEEGNKKSLLKTCILPFNLIYVIHWCTTNRTDII